MENIFKAIIPHTLAHNGQQVTVYQQVLLIVAANMHAIY
jgi:hypothetical protein